MQVTQNFTITKQSSLSNYPNSCKHLLPKKANVHQNNFRRSWDSKKAISTLNFIIKCIITLFWWHLSPRQFIFTLISKLTWTLEIFLLGGMLTLSLFHFNLFMFCPWYVLGCIRCKCMCTTFWLASSSFCTVAGYVLPQASRCIARSIVLPCSLAFLTPLAFYHIQKLFYFPPILCHAF